MVHAGCVFVAGVHSSRTWMSGSLESVRWNASVQRLDFGLFSHSNEFGGVRTHVNSKGKIPSTGKNSPQRRIEPKTLHQAGQRAQDTTNELFRPPKLFNKAIESHHKWTLRQKIKTKGYDRFTLLVCSFVRLFLCLLCLS